MSWFKGDNARDGGNNKRQSSYNLDELRADVVDKISVAVMMVNRDFIVTFVNEPTRQLLKANFAAFRALWPNFDPDKIVGTCIDTFHKIRPISAGCCPMLPSCRCGRKSASAT